MTVRLLHTADWQIGKGFRHIPGDKGALIREQRLATVSNLATLAAEQRVDAVLVAGDVFDDNAVSDQTLRRAMEAMRGFDGPWVLLPGNHDAALAESAWTRVQRLGAQPPNVHFALTPEPIPLAAGALAVLPAPLRRRHEPRDLTEWFDDARTGEVAVRVGLAHGSVQNRLPAEAEAQNPISDTRAETAGLDYLALGDWHGTLRIADRTWYAGTPETDRFRSRDPGHALLVTLSGPGEPPAVEVLETTHYRWHEIEMPVADGQVDTVDDRLAALGEPWDRHVVSLSLSGVLGLAERARLDDVLAGWDARLQYLDTRLEGLHAEAGEDDLAELGGRGFVGAAVERLQAARDAGVPWAGDALQRLYLAYRWNGGESS